MRSIPNTRIPRLYFLRKVAHSNTFPEGPRPIGIPTNQTALSISTDPCNMQKNAAKMTIDNWQDDKWLRKAF